MDFRKSKAVNLGVPDTRCSPPTLCCLLVFDQIRETNIVNSRVSRLILTDGVKLDIAGEITISTLERNKTHWSSRFNVLP